MSHSQGQQEEISSSEDEFYEISGEDWFTQCDTDEEEGGENRARAPDAAPSKPTTPRQTEFGGNSMPDSNAASANRPTANGNGFDASINRARSEPTVSSSFRGPSTLRANHNLDRAPDTDDEDDTLRSLRGEFESLHTHDTPTRPLGRARTEPLAGSTLDTPERRAWRQKLVETIEASRESFSPSPPPSRPVSSRTHAPPRAANQAYLSRSATMPTAPPEAMATAPLPRSQSMNNPDTASTASPNSPVPDGYVAIAHDEVAQRLMDSLEVAWSAQYEIARGVSMGYWDWQDVTEDRLKHLSGNRWGAAQRVGEVFKKPLAGQKPDIWAELEREQKAIIEDATRGLGLMGDWEGEANWYGGRVQQIARFVKTASGRFTLQLSAMQKVKLPKGAVYDQKIMDEIRELLSQKFILCGRVFEAFSVKDEKVYLVETDENYQRTPKDSDGDHHRYSLQTLVNWYNPLELNNKQTLSKYAARADLAMSTSVPVLEFSSRNIFKIDDICAPHTGGGKVPTEKIFTDGCGFMNGAALMKIGSWMGFGAPPTAVQGRILGSKGVWLLHPTDRAPDAEPRIWIRPSQMKINLVDPAVFGPDALGRLHRAHRVFDLVNPSRSTVPARLSRLTIVNLQHNGVPTHVLVELMKTGLQEEAAALTQWHGASAMPLLWNAVNKASAVSSQRLRRAAAGIQRALGLTRRPRDDDSDEDDELDAAPGAAPVDPDAADDDSIMDHDDVDVPPASMAEDILERIQAGFTPLKDYHLYDKLKVLLTQVMQSYIKEYHIVVPESAEAFIVPDPFGILEENEIHFKSSQDLKDGCLHLNPKYVTGEVLIYRNPARVPSDVQKVTAVCRPELADYIDVIILPIKGARSLANLLAGGDVDGDVAVCIFNQQIVEAFRPPPITEEPANFLSTYFESMAKVPTVASVVQEMDAYPAEAADRLRRHLLIGISESRVGKYSLYHENAIYTLGYDDPNTQRLAFMFTTVLDSRKTGLIVKPAVLQADQQYGHRKPVCLGGDERADRLPRRDPNLGPFVLEELLDEGKRIQDALLRDYEGRGKQLRPGTTDSGDSDLLQPWRNVETALQASEGLPAQLKAELETLRAHVVNVRQEWDLLWSRARHRNNGYVRDTKEHKKKDQRKKAELAKLYAQVPDGCGILALLGNVEKLKASCLYSLNPNAAFAFAHQALCKIKTETAGSTAFTREFAQAMSISGAEVRVRSQLNTVESVDERMT